MKKSVLLLMLVSSALGMAQTRLTDNENRFYTDTFNKKVVEVQLTGQNSENDSDLLNAKITSLSNAGGGTIHIRKGLYYLIDILLKSNIHLKIDKEVVLQPYFSPNSKKVSSTIFEVGKQFKVENVAITNADEDNEDKSTWFSAVFPKGDYRMKIITACNVRNFKFSGFKIKDSYTPFSSIALNLPDSKDRNEVATGGIVKDILLVDSHVGYGVIQIQAAKTVLCKNLEGIGGVTMRVETGSGETGTANIMTVDDIVGRNIKVKNGDAALNLSPHRVNQGRVDAEGIFAVNSSFAVQIAAGFKDKKLGGVDNMGTFDHNSYIGNIKATGGIGAQVKAKDFMYFNCDEQKEMIAKKQNPDNESTPGRSIGVIRTNATASSGCKNGKDGGCYEVHIGNIERTNTNFVMTEDYTFKNMGNTDCNVAIPGMKAKQGKEKSKEGSKKK